MGMDTASSSSSAEDGVDTIPVGAGVEDREVEGEEAI